MTFFERVGEVACVAFIVFCVWFAGRALIAAVHDLGPICASIGGGCQ